MPTTVHTFADIEFNMRLNQVRATEGLNQQQAISTPHGVYRGFNLTDGGGAILTIEPDLNLLDNFAITLTDTGSALVVRKVGSFNVDLSALADGDYYVAVVGNYSLVTTTTMQIQTYTEAEYDALSDADRQLTVFLGRINITGGVVAVQLTGDRRSAYQNTSPEQALWMPVITNGGFERGESQTLAPFEVANTAFGWEIEAITNGRWQLSTTEANSGNVSMALIASAAAPISALDLVQYLNIPLAGPKTAAGRRRLRFRMYVYEEQAATAGTLRVTARFLTDLSNFADWFIVTDPVDTGGAVWRKIEVTFELPTNAVVLERITITTSSLTYPVASTGLYVDDVQLWVESENGDDPPVEAPMHLLADNIIFPATSVVLNERSPMLRRVGTSIALQRADRQDPTNQQGPDLLLFRGGQQSISFDQTEQDSDNISPRHDIRHAYATGLGYTPGFFTHLLRSYLDQNDDDGAGVHFYSANLDVSPASAAAIITVNAQWDPSLSTDGQWEYDENTPAEDALRLVFQAAGGSGSTDNFFKIQRYNGASPWDDSAWVDMLSYTLGGGIEVESPSGQGLAFNNPDLSTEALRGTERLALGDVGARSGVGGQERYILLMHVPDAGNIGDLRLYYRHPALNGIGVGGLVITVNCFFTESTQQWTTDSSNYGVGFFFGGNPMNADEFCVLSNSTAGGVWSNTAWREGFGVGTGSILAGTSTVYDDLDVDGDVVVNGTTELNDDLSLDADLTSNNVNIGLARPFAVDVQPFTAGRKIILRQGNGLVNSVFEEYIDFTALAADGAAGTNLLAFSLPDVGADAAYSFQVKLELAGAAFESAARTLHYNIVWNGAAFVQRDPPGSGITDFATILAEQGREEDANVNFTEAVVQTTTNITPGLTIDWLVNLAGLANGGTRLDTNWVGKLIYCIAVDT